MDKGITPIERACRLAGGQNKLARLLGVSATAISQWVAHQRQVNNPYARPVPEYRAIQIHKLSDGRVTYRELRPDLNNRWDLYEQEMKQPGSQLKEAAQV